MLFFMLMFFPDVGMRVGADYQANIPEFEPGEFFSTGFYLSDGRG